MRVFLTTIAGAMCTATLVFANPAPEHSNAPKPRPEVSPVQANASQPQSLAFARWIDRFRSRAIAAGIRPQVFDRAFQGARLNTDVIERDRNQAEFTRTLGDYVGRVVSDKRLSNGRDALRRHRQTLARIEARYGVEAEVVTAIWGLETGYGAFRGKTPVIPALATLAFEGRRGAFFEKQLIAALQILQAGDITPERMLGSWAGAMGHTQFIPTSYLALAVDFDGDGKRNIWADDPTDALASTAAYLARSGWTKGQPWAVEVQLPRSFDYALTGDHQTKSPADWARLGVRDANGQRVPDHGAASIIVPAGADGTALMIFDNFHAISRYNNSDAYVIGVGHLSDRIGGAGPFRAGWPEGERALTRAEKAELQRRLTAAGHNTQGADGIIGPNTTRAVRSFQSSVGLTPDGYASPKLLGRLR